MFQRVENFTDFHLTTQPEIKLQMAPIIIIPGIMKDCQVKTMKLWSANANENCMSSEELAVQCTKFHATLKKANIISKMATTSVKSWLHIPVARHLLLCSQIWEQVCDGTCIDNLSLKA